MWCIQWMCTIWDPILFTNHVCKRIMGSHSVYKPCGAFSECAHYGIPYCLQTMFLNTLWDPILYTKHVCKCLHTMSVNNMGSHTVRTHWMHHVHIFSIGLKGFHWNRNMLPGMYYWLHICCVWLNKLLYHDELYAWVGLAVFNSSEKKNNLQVAESHVAVC